MTKGQALNILDIMRILVKDGTESVFLEKDDMISAISIGCECIRESILREDDLK